MNDSVKNIMIVGVGGQGTLLASKMLGYVLMHQGYDVKVSEVHGMSQRGGSVVTYVIFGQIVYSPIIDKGESDFIVSFEKLEAARYVEYLRPDGKTQVTVEYNEEGKPIRIDAVVCSTQHDPEVTQEQIHEDIKKYVFDEIIPADMVDDETKYFINPTGRFVIGGPHGDSGLTGRKIIVDTYGGAGRHGGGAFSGKDCTKVDRSAAYAARYVAKNIVAAGLAKKCEIQLSYAIGVAHPTSIMVDTFGTGVLEDDKLVEIIRENFDLRPAGIIQMLDLRRPIYKQTAAYGHFGRTDIDLPWEKLDKVEDLKKYLQKFYKSLWVLWCEAPIFHAIIFFSGGQIHEAENAISYSIFYDYHYTGPYGSHDGFNGMPLSDRSGGEELWDYRNDDF